MAKNSVDAYGAKGKTNLLMFDPDMVELVYDESHPLYDHRVHMPVDEALVLNIGHHGVLEPIIVAKDPETGKTQVVAGRQRVKAAREANRRLRGRGCMPIQVPAVVRRSDPVDLAGVMVSENEVRQADTPMGRAAKMRRLMGYGRTEAELAILFGCGVATVKNTLALLECCADVRQAVDAGEIGVTHAKTLARLPPDAQRAKVVELREVGGAGHAKARAVRQIVKGDAPRMRTRKEVAAEVEASSGERRRALEWVLGVNAGDAQ